MARVETQITFASAAFISVNSATQGDSDSISWGSATFAGSIEVSVDNQSTPAAGDTIDLYWKPSNGDVLGDTGDDFVTDEYALPLGKVDTFATNTPGEDPARVWYELPIASKSGKLSWKATSQAATRQLVLRARVVEVNPT